MPDRHTAVSVTQEQNGLLHG